MPRVPVDAANGGRVRRGGTFRVVRVIARLNIGGPAQHVVNLTRGLSRAYPTLLVCGSVDDGEEEMADVLAQEGVSVHRIPELGRALRPGQDIAALFKLVRLLRDVRPEIVHTHTAKAGTLGRLAAVMAGVPHRIHTFHGHTFHGYFHPSITQVFLGIERLLGRATERVIALSDAQAEDLAGRYRVASRRALRVVPLGLDLPVPGMENATALRREFREEVGARDLPVVTTVGRLVPVKRHDLFVDAVAALRGKGVEGVFVVVGGGPERERIERSAARAGVADRLRFLGWRRDLARIYAGSDVVALCSDNEGTPVALIEAMAAGVPVVATAVGGVPDVLDGGRLGVLVPPASAPALAEGIETLLAHPTLRADLCARARPAAVARYGVARLLADVAALYDELLQGGNGSASAGGVSA
jgi:glycosyltransferase involved in cell wall biosynthesis